MQVKRLEAKVTDLSQIKPGMGCAYHDFDDDYFSIILDTVRIEEDGEIGVRCRTLDSRKNNDSYLDWVYIHYGNLDCFTFYDNGIE